MLYNDSVNLTHRGPTEKIFQYNFSNDSHTWINRFYVLLKFVLIGPIDNQTKLSEGPLYRHGITKIPAWMSKNMPCKEWDDITYPFPNVNIVAR